MARLLYIRSSLYVTDSKLKSNKAEMGGVAFILESSAVFASSEFKACRASRYGSGGSDIRTISIDSCNLIGNYVPRGGVVDLSNSAINSNTTLLLHKNHANGYAGGVIYSRLQCNISLTSSLFKNNYAFIGGVMYISSTKFNTMSYFINVSNCYFLENHTEEDGGVFSLKCKALFYYTAIPQLLSLKNSRFICNNTGSNGGVLYATNLIISDIGNTYTNNSATNGSVKHVSSVKLESFNSYFDINFANKGIVIFFEAEVKYSGVTFHSNMGSGLIASDSIIYFNGKINFTANVIEEKLTTHSNEYLHGGAIRVTLSIITFNTTHTIFNNNVGGNSGGAISLLSSYLNVLSSITQYQTTEYKQEADFTCIRVH